MVRVSVDGGGTNECCYMHMFMEEGGTRLVLPAKSEMAGFQTIFH